jgi:hypothetical protein
LTAESRNAGIHIRVDSNLPRAERDWVVGFVSFLRAYYTFPHPLRIRIYGTERIIWDHDDWAELAWYPEPGEASPVDVRIAAGRWNSLTGGPFSWR